MILDEKQTMLPPPSYAASQVARPFTPRNGPPSLASLPSHILLLIIYSTFPRSGLLDEDKSERQRKALYWISASLRLVNRTSYIASMHVLRSIYLPAYDALINPPYTSDPFPFLAPTPDAPALASPYGPTAVHSISPLKTIQRETATLDLFIALKVRQDVWSDATELHLEREEAYNDLFVLTQPRSRLEDLIRIYGVQEGVVTLSPNPSPVSSRNSSTVRLPSVSTPPPSSRSRFPPSPTSSSSIFSSLFAKKPPKASPPPTIRTPPTKVEIAPIPFHLLSVSFSPRQVGLVLHPAKRTILTTQRSRDERLESAAKRLVMQLRSWLEEGG